MRRAALATFLCAAALPVASAQAAPTLDDRVAARDLVSDRAAAASNGFIPLPLPEAAPPARASAAGASEEAVIAAREGRQRVLVGVHEHADLPGVAAAMRRLGAEPEPFPEIGVLAADVPSGAELTSALAGDPRVDYIERDRSLRVSADPFDSLDPLTGIPYTWYYDRVRAAEAIAAAGGGSARVVAVIDTGIDRNHPEFGGDERIAGVYDTASRTQNVTDNVGHGTFVSGLISAIDGNGVGAKGVAGNTKILAVRGSRDGTFTVSDLIRGVAFSVRARADVLNMSLAGRGFSRSQARVLEAAFYNDVLPVAASGNNGRAGNPLEFPAAALGGRNGKAGIGLSVSATGPDDAVAPFSNHNRYVTLAAPGAGSDAASGVFSTLPANFASAWETRSSQSRIYASGGARYAYAEGTSFAAPLAAGIAALVWQVEPRLASEQVAQVLACSARKTGSQRGWNEFAGHGIVDGAAATWFWTGSSITIELSRI